MQSKQYFTKIKNYPHEKSTEPNKGKNKPFPKVGQGLLNGRLLQSAAMDCTVHCSRPYGPLQRIIQSAAGDCSNPTDRRA